MNREEKGRCYHKNSLAVKLMSMSGCGHNDILFTTNNINVTSLSGIYYIVVSVTIKIK